jgi:hypothetical protein
MPARLRKVGAVIFAADIRISKALGTPLAKAFRLS